MKLTRRGLLKGLLGLPAVAVLRGPPSRVPEVGQMHAQVHPEPGRGVQPVEQNATWTTTTATGGWTFVYTDLTNYA